MPQTILTVVPAYAAVLGLIYAALALRTLSLRRRHGVGVGTANKDGEVRSLTRAIRAHGNFAEYVPICLLLIAFYEITIGPSPTLHGFCLLLIAGRLIHAFGISREPEKLLLRVIGMVMTLTVLIGISIRLLFSLVA